MIIKTIENKDDRKLNKNYLELENNDWKLDQYFFNGYVYKNGHIFGELYIPEGVKVIMNASFSSLDYIRTYHFPKSLEKIQRNLFNDSEYRKIDYIKIVYKGNSNDFIELAKVEVKEVCESDGFDRYPYYSGNSRWVTYYYSFDERVNHIEVYCEEDDVYLDYGCKHRKDDELPKIRKL